MLCLLEVVVKGTVVDLGVQRLQTNVLTGQHNLLRELTRKTFVADLSPKLIQPLHRHTINIAIKPHRLIISVPQILCEGNASSMPTGDSPLPVVRIEVPMTHANLMIVQVSFPKVNLLLLDQLIMLMTDTLKDSNSMNEIHAIFHEMPKGVDIRKGML